MGILRITAVEPLESQDFASRRTRGFWRCDNGVNHYKSGNGTEMHKGKLAGGLSHSEVHALANADDIRAGEIKPIGRPKPWLKRFLYLA